MLRIAMILVAIGTALAGSGCAAYMAANQPGKKDVAVLSKGQPRARLIAELGPPISTETKDGVRRDIFKFTQGYHTAAKVGRAVLHGAADVVTLGLWEVVGTPTEGYFNGTEVSAEVIYDANDNVDRIVPLRGVEEIPQGTGVAAAPPLPSQGAGDGPRQSAASSSAQPNQ